MLDWTIKEVVFPTKAKGCNPDDDDEDIDGCLPCPEGCHPCGPGCTPD